MVKRRLVLVGGILALACLFMPPGSFGLAGEEEDLFAEIPKVTTASRFEQLLLEAPSSVTVITDEDIRRYGYRTLAEILQSVPGFYVTNDYNYSFVGVRGFLRSGDYNSRILLLLDGIRVNEPIEDAAAIGLELVVDVDLIDRVEVVRGPSSSIYGANAFFAVVNVLTKDGRDFGGAEIAAHVGDNDTYGGRVTWGDQLANGLGVTISATTYDSAGEDLYFPEYDDPETNDGWAVGVDDERAHNAFAKLAHGPFSFSAAHVSRDKSIPTGSFETVFNHPGNRTTDEQTLVGFGYRTTLAGDVDLDARIHYNHYYYIGEYVYDYADPGDPEDLVSNFESIDAARVGAEVTVGAALAQRHHLLVGAEARYDLRLDQRAWDPFEVYLDDARDAHNWGLFIQDEIKLGSRARVNAGLRFDDYDSFGTAVNPRLAFIFAPDQSSALKLLYGEAYRPPNAYELYLEDGGLTTKPSPDLQPEEMTTYEIVYERLLGASTRGSVSAYFYQIDGLITQIEDPADELLVFVNLESVEAWGLELVAERRLAGGLDGRVSFALQNAEDRETGDELANSPSSLFQMSISKPFFSDHLVVGLEERYMSDRLTVTGERVSSHAVTDLTILVRRLAPGLELSFSAYNLFDEEYADPVGVEFEQESLRQPGRSFRLKAIWSF